MATKKQTKKVSVHTEVHGIWGWVILGVGILAIFAVAGWYYLSMV